MRYCTKCKKLINNDDKTACVFCGRKTITDPNHFSPVKLITANGFEFERIRAALDDADIPYSYNEAPMDAGIQILNSAPPENCDIYVPLSAYSDACDILAGIGALKEADMPDSTDEMLSNAKKEAQSEELTPSKARTIRMLSLIAFLLILAGVTFLTDFVIELIRSAFS